MRSMSPRGHGPTFATLATLAALACAACGGSSGGAKGAADGGGAATGSGSGASSSRATVHSTAVAGDGGASAAPGNPAAPCPVPSAAAAEDVSAPTTVVGKGTPASCTSDAVVAAVQAGGVVTFDCGAAPVVIVVPTIEIFNDGGKTGDGSVTIDGGGRVTLSGGGQNRILYQNTCDESLHWTTSHCQDQPAPHLVLQNLGLTAGSAGGSSSELGGGAVYVGGGTFKMVNVTVTNSTEPTLEQDYAGGAVYTFNQATQPVTIAGSTFSGNSGCNGGALGSIGTSYTILNSVLSHNKTLGHGENPAQPGTPGCGLGGAIYNDGDGYTLSICGSLFEDNTAADLGSGSIFMVADDLKGSLVLDRSTFSGNSDTGAVQGTAHPSIYVQAGDVPGVAGVTITDTTFD